MIEVIAEIGVNHNGDYHTACLLVDAAKSAGCDTAKFQLWDTERVYPRERWDEMKRLELSRWEIESLKLYCDDADIEFLCTPDEIEDAHFLKEIGVKRIKTSSQDICNRLFLREVAILGLPLIVSTGACTQDELMQATWVLEVRNHNITVLHCVSAYPAPIDQMNLRVIEYLRKFRTDWAVGLSDHTRGNSAALISLGLGATVFEKHITLDCDQPGPDHAASFDPVQMADYVQRLRDGEKALGDGIKRIMPCEMENRKRYEKFIEPRMTHADSSASSN